MQSAERPVASPRALTPPRTHGSARRTSHIEMRRPGGPAAELLLIGAARDLVTRRDGTTAVAATALIRARLGTDHRLLELSTDPVETGAETLLGRLVGSGFRRAVAASFPRHAEGGTPLHLLLDDLPVAALVSGFSLLHAARGDASAAPPPMRPAPDVCAGWRTGGSAMLALAGGSLAPRALGPRAAALEDAGDPLSWHLMERLGPGDMRRCRRIDVTPGTVLRIDAMVRDSYVDAAGVERALHDYSVIAEADPGSLEVRHIEATPHTLPYTECMAAAATAAVARGAHVPLLRNLVEQALYGPASCTHLNDLLRSLADGGRLAALLA